MALLTQLHRQPSACNAGILVQNVEYVRDQHTHAQLLKQGTFSCRLEQGKFRSVSDHLIGPKTGNYQYGYQFMKKFLSYFHIFENIHPFTRSNQLK